MKKLMISLAIASFSLGSMAQEVSYPVRENSVETNGFWSNWYLSVGGGVQIGAYELPDGVKTFDTMTPIIDLSIGKWFTPSLGLRGQFEIPYISKYYQYSTDDKCNYGAVYAEAMFNLTNMFCGYKSDRVYNAIPFVGFGRAWGENYGDKGVWSPWKVGLLNTFRLSQAWTINAELACKQINSLQVGNRCWEASASLGLSYYFKKRTFDASPDMAAVIAMHDAQVAALNEVLAAKDKDNQALKSQLAKKPKEIVKEKVVKEVAPVASQSVFFEFNSAKIASKKEIINLQALAEMSKASNVRLQVVGYADNATGSAQYNQQLSLRRAQAVADELVKLGVSKSNIVVEGKGGVQDLQPASYNRRVIIGVQ